MLRWLSSIPQDKLLHFLTGCVGACVLSIVLGVWLSFGIVCLSAILKEVYDHEHPDKHTAEVWDAVASMLGGMCVWAPLWWHR